MVVPGIEVVPGSDVVLSGSRVVSGKNVGDNVVVAKSSNSYSRFSRLPSGDCVVIISSDET
jgi:NADPH:quinone reductase-like Zn-dependent oxidoreductase